MQMKLRAIMTPEFFGVIVRPRHHASERLQVQINTLNYLI